MLILFLVQVSTGAGTLEVGGRISSMREYCASLHLPLVYVTWLILSLFTFTSCKEVQPDPSTSAVNITTKWFTISIPLDWEVRCRKNTYTFISPTRNVSVALAPVALKPSDRAETVVKEVEDYILAGKPDRVPVKHWRGEYLLGGRKYPALYVQEKLLKERQSERLEVVNFAVERKGWLLGITVIAKGTLNERHSEVEGILSSLTVYP